MSELRKGFEGLVKFYEIAIVQCRPRGDGYFGKLSSREKSHLQRILTDSIRIFEKYSLSQRANKYVSNFNMNGKNLLDLFSSKSRSNGETYFESRNQLMTENYLVECKSALRFLYEII